MASPCAPKTPKEAGYTSKAALMAAGAAHPELRPCPRHRDGAGLMCWIERKFCKKCPRYDGSQDQFSCAAGVANS